MLLLGFLSAIIGKTKHCPVKLKKTQPLCILMCILTSSQIALATEFEYKAVFSAPCLEVMTLNTPVPELTKYTVCTYLKLASSDPWAAFTYQLPTSPIDTYELGLVGDSSSLKIWMFGTQISVFEKLNLETWYEMCIIWNGNDKSMGFYLNGSLKERRKLENHSKLAGGGNVRLGCSHFKEVNASVSVGLVGEMYMFRMWNTAQSSHFQKCKDGNVIKWKRENWIYSPVVIQQDPSLHCAKEKSEDPTSAQVDLQGVLPVFPTTKSSTTGEFKKSTSSAKVDTAVTNTLTSGSNTFSAVETTNITNVTGFTIATSESKTLWSSSLNMNVSNGNDTFSNSSRFSTSSVTTKINNGSSSWSNGVTSHRKYITSAFSQITNGLPIETFSSPSSTVSSNVTAGSMNCASNDTSAFKNRQLDICNMTCGNDSVYEFKLKNNCTVAESTLKRYLQIYNYTKFIMKTCRVLVFRTNDTAIDICDILIRNAVFVKQYIQELNRIDYYCCCQEECSFPNCILSTPVCSSAGRSGSGRSVTVGFQSTGFNNSDLMIGTSFVNGSGRTVYSGPSTTFTKGSSTSFNNGHITSLNPLSNTTVDAGLRTTINGKSDTTVESDITLTVNSKSKTTLNSESTLTDNGANATDNHGTTVSFSNGSNTAGDQGTMVTINRERNGKGNNESHTTVNSGHMTTVDSGTHTIVSKGPVTTLNDGLNTTVNSGSTGTTNSKSSSTVNSGSMATLNNEFNTTANSGSTMTTNSGSSSTVNSESITTINNGFNTMANSGSTRITNSGSSSIVNSGSMTTINDTLDTTANSGSTRITNSGSTSTVNSGSMTTINNGLNTAGNNEPTRTSANKTTVDTGVMSTFYSESETASEYNQSVTSTSGSSSSDNTAIPTGFTDGLYNLTDIFDSNHLNASIVNYLVSKMEDLLSGEVNPEDARRLLDVLNKFLNVSPTLLGPFSNRLIKIVDKIGLQLTFPGKCISLTSQSLALAVVKVNDSSFTGTSFGVESSSALNVSLGSQASANSDGSILLPASLITDLSPEDKKYASRVQFNYYAQTSFFQDPFLQANQQLVSKVISSSVANLSITNLKENVTVTLKTSANNISDQVECVFWDFDKNNGSGGWSADGCLVAKRTQSEAVCKCNHLTSFAILMNVSPNEPINPEDLLVLTFITYIGCGLSAIFLSVTLITYIAFEKIRRDYPSKILIQLCAALVCLNLTFLLNPWIALYNDIPGLCISVAAFLHYFVLVSITWMGLEAFHMYLSLVKVFNTYVRKYILKFCIIGWGAPAVVVAIILAIKKDSYFLKKSGIYPNGSVDYFCWVDDIVFWITVVGYFGVIFLLNVSMFVVVLIQLCRIKKQKQLGYQRKTTFQDMRSVAGITFLLGITWGLGFFSFGPGRTAIMYLFTIFNSLQGFFIFFFYCVVKENARKQWRRYLCCGKLRLAENSDWSKTATNKLRKQTSKQGVSSSSSNSIQSSSNTNSTTLLVSNEHSLHLNGNGNAFKERNGASFKLQNGEMPLQQIAGRPSTKNGDVPQNSLRRTSNKGSVHFIDQI
ncbi:adhesion G-protein coupled receptor G2 [Eleutherodactylus coqui]|uniref:adhesion G-protein coupled receptor G2 n=1 Tax=Eleutherodactylus coqui TaxID=57060 RepID=UPI003462CADD